MKSPVLLLAYNRPKEINKVLNFLIRLKVSKIYISVDGPKNNKKDINAHKQIKKILNFLQNKKIKINYLKKNYGCKKAVEKGINWFFSHVEMGIILEDDCMPNRSFFIFCEKMLKKYKNTQVKVISGNNFLREKINISNHCYFSKFNHCWGWATWKDAWSLYDDKYLNWNKFKKSNYWNNLFTNKVYQNYWEKIFDLSRKKRFDSWAYPWLYSIWYNKGFTIIPKYNLVRNTGYIGTHNTFNLKFDFKTKELNANFKFPKEITINKKADDFVMENFFVPKNFLWPTRFIYLIKRFFQDPNLFIKTMFKKIGNKNVII